MNTYILRYVGDFPVGKRVLKSKTGHLYIPKEIKDFKEELQKICKVCNGYEKYERNRAVSVNIDVYFPVPIVKRAGKKTFRLNDTEREAMLGMGHRARPDVDNIIGIVLDSLNGIAYEDDSQVFDVSCSKFYHYDFEQHQKVLNIIISSNLS